MNKVGRPLEPNALRKTGKKFIVWLSKTDTTRLENFAETLEISKSELFRRLVKEIKE